MTLRRVARPRLLDSHCLLENSIGLFREIALFPILLFFRFALRFGHVESCHRSTLREILKFKLTPLADFQPARPAAPRTITNYTAGDSDETLSVAAICAWDRTRAPALRGAYVSLGVLRAIVRLLLHFDIASAAPESRPELQMNPGRVNV
jgi:hypothetical protein